MKTSSSTCFIHRVVTVAYLCGVNITSNASNGLTVIGLPRLKEDLDLHPSLAFWPLSVYGLATASTLLLAGAIADVAGPRIVSADTDLILSPGSLLAASLSLVTAVLFVFWMHFRAKNDQVALIPNEVWKNASFTSICVTVALSFAVLNSLDLMTSLYFQNIKHLSALEAAIRMVPSTLVGLALNILTGLVVNKIRANWLVALASLLSAGSPLLMALIQPEWPYWKCAFPAQILMPFSVDVLFTISLIVITDVFPNEKQAVAGAVFNTAGQLGNTMGLAAMQVISTRVTRQPPQPPYNLQLLDWNDSTPERRLAITDLVDKSPHMPRPAHDASSETPSSSVPLSQRPDIPDMSSDGFTQPVWNPSSKQRNPWREGFPQMATPTTSSHVYPVPSRPPMTSNQATAELNKLLSELEEARNRYNRLLPQTVDAQVDMERCEAKVKEFYVAHGLML
ncbi:hypothetical protein FPRO05_13972 [Fusarium proliferatum]|uniref:Major facilitator superfamily (MFS) profile domain-containing protein n=2 Tax=Gibberella intermedia TaxID=948311 RepID=A0A365MX28_GIBIN|nr:hypothetical protein FPRO05_13972 [Fusarium proliferatum]